MPRGCGVVLLLDVARLRRCLVGCCLGGHDCRFTRVSRSQPAPATPVSRAFHARLARPSPKRLWPRTRARTGLRRPAQRLARRPTGRHPSTSSATHHAAELRHTRYPHEHSLDTEAELTSCTDPYHLDRLLRCGAVIPEQRSEHGPRQR